MFRFFVVLVLFASTVLFVTFEARAQAPERRIAFVVGNESYADGALPTAANDAGLIAQTLQAAGFEVVGARDLDAETFRESYAEFLKRLSAAGPDAVAFVYLAGYGLQYGNDNFFVPIGARLANDTDVPISAVRLADLAGPLSTLPLKARFLVFDIGHVPPFRVGGAPLAGGLALVEAGAGTAIAFNAAPGTVAPVGKGNYGLYAQSLAAELRVGGLSPGEIFDRVRLRVSEQSQGAEVPWDDTKVDPAFRFFDRGADAPPQAPPAVADAMMRQPLRELPPQQAYPAALARDTVRSYDEFIRAYPDDPLAKRARVLLAARREALTWQRSAAVGTAAAYWSYLRRYPRGPHAGAADMRLRQIAATLQPPADFVPIGYDVPPPPPDEIVYVDRPAVYLADPSYDLPPPPPPPVEWLPAVPVAFLDQPPPRRATGLFELPAPIFVPLPAFFNPPRFVAVPQENVFFSAPGGIDRRQVIGTRGVGIDIHRVMQTGPGGRGPVGLVPLPGAAAQRATVLESRGIRTPEQLRDIRQRPGGVNRVLSGPARDGLPPAQRLPGDGARPLPPGGNVRPLPGPSPGPGGPGPRGPGGVLPGERGPGAVSPGGRGPGTVVLPGSRGPGIGPGERRPAVTPPGGPAGNRGPGARPSERGPVGSPPGGRPTGARPGERGPEGGAPNGRGPGARPGERRPASPGERGPNVRPERGPGGPRPAERSPGGVRGPGPRGPAEARPGGDRPNERPGGSGAGPGPGNRGPGEMHGREPRPSESRPGGRGPGAERGEPRPRPGAGRPEGGGRMPPGAGPGGGRGPGGGDRGGGGLGGGGPGGGGAGHGPGGGGGGRPGGTGGGAGGARHGGGGGGGPGGGRP